MLSQLRPALISFAALTLVTGVTYPAIVTGIAKLCFPSQADGSVIEYNGSAIGSSLIGQPFTNAKYFWPRPSAAGANGYDAANGSGSNLGPSNPALADAVKTRIDALRSADPGNTAAIPADLVTASGSGLDPHISIDAAMFQLARVARARGRGQNDIRLILDAHTEVPAGGVFGERRVNVLLVNLALDGVRIDQPNPATSQATTTDTGIGWRAAGFTPDAR